MQGSQGRRQKEEKVCLIPIALKLKGPLRRSGPSHLQDFARTYFLRGGICNNSVTCSWDSCLSRNFSFTASAIAPSRSANLSVCMVSLGWNFSIDSFNSSTG